MTDRLTTGRFALFAAALGAAIAASGDAIAADGVRVRGTVAAFDGSTLTVKSREGNDVAISLDKGWGVSSVAAASADAIKTGDFVGIASLPMADGKAGALEVVIFPAAMKGTGEGSREWDLKPNSTMTNGTVGNAVKAVSGRTVSVTYNGSEKLIAIPDTTPIVTFAPAQVSDIKPGATVFVPSKRDSAGALSSGRVVVGTNGVVPPM
jgi:YD repeat-containing protein